MNRKVEDRLIELAFGDISPDEAHKLEAQAAVDPSAAARLQEYRDMRSSLRAMADVPEHQLSNERLRDAILSRGLATSTPTPAASSSRGWLWMPVAACAMAFTLVMWRNAGPRTAPELVLGPGLDEKVAFNPPTLENSASTTQLSVPEGIEKSSSKPVVQVKEVKVPVTVEKIVYLPAPEKANAMRVASVDRPKRQSGSVRTAKAAAEEPETKEPIIIEAAPIVPEQPIILIAQEMDADTGAQVATEVESESNVLVGG